MLKRPGSSNLQRVGLLLILPAIVFAIYDSTWLHYNRAVWILGNWGIFGREGGFPGIYHPRPVRNFYAYGASPWVGCIVGSETLVTAGYNPLTETISEFVPTLCRYWRQGYTDPRDRIYIYPEDWPPPRDRFPMAPVRPLSRFDVWTCFGDSDPRHHNTRPLGIDVALTAYIWDSSPAKDFFLLKYELFNNNSSPLRDVYFGIFLNGDVGWYRDDLAAFLRNRVFRTRTSSPIDTIRVKNTGFVYDFNNWEALSPYWEFGTPGAIVISLLSAPPGVNLSAFKIFTDENDPLNDNQKYLALAGYTWYLDPPPYQPFDSVDLEPGNKRILMSCGPFDLMPDSCAQFYFFINLSPHGRLLETGPKHETVRVALGYYWAKKFFLERILGVGIEEAEGKGPSPFFAIYPNPFKSSLTIRALTKEEVEVKIYNSKGGLVKSLRRRPPIFWNGRDEKGRTLPSGIYFLAISYKENAEMRKVLLIR